jgi:hypothetical protein
LSPCYVEYAIYLRPLTVNKIRPKILLYVKQTVGAENDAVKRLHCAIRQLWL